MEKVDPVIPAQELLLEYIKIACSLKELKEAELKIRKYLCEVVFSGQQGELSAKFETKNFSFEAKSVVNRSVDVGVLASINSDLTEEEASIIRYKPSLDLRKYRALPATSLLQEAVIIKPGTPQLKVKMKES